MIIIMNILFIAVIIMFFFAGPEGRPSAIRGGAIGGAIVGVIIGLFIGDIFLGGKYGLTIGGIIGVISEIWGRWSDKQRENK